MIPAGRVVCGLIVGVLASIGCGAPGGATSGRSTVGTAVVSSSTGTLRAMDAAMTRADSAALVTRSIDLEPTTLELRVGQSVVLFQLIRMTARDAMGQIVSEFVPALRVDDPSLFERSGPSVTPVRPGETRLEVRPMIFDTARISSRVMASVRIIVRP